MRYAVICLASVLLACVATPAAAADSARERAVKRCQENRGTDCTSEQGLRPWLEEEEPMTEGQRRSAVGAANARKAEEKRLADERRAAEAQKAKDKAAAEKKVK